MNILFITSNRIGDAMLSTGLLDYLVHQYLDSDVTVVCGPGTEPLFTHANNVRRVITMVKQRRAGHWIALWREVVKIPWDIVIDLRASAISYLLRAKQRYVLDTSKSKEMTHRVVQLANLMDLERVPNPRLWLSAETRAEANQRLPKGGLILAVGPTANWSGKQWPAENFAEAVLRLTASDGLFPDARIAVLGGPGEQAMAAPMIDRLPADKTVNLVGQTDVALAGACLNNCSYFIGNDSGLMHVAAAVGVPTLGLFGPSREEHYGPWGEFSSFVRTPESYDEIVGGVGYDHKSSESRMKNLTVDAVVAAADSHFKGLFGG
jgi:ADP-heptose:LPS heptosyltransferase